MARVHCRWRFRTPHLRPGQGLAHPAACPPRARASSREPFCPWATTLLPQLGVCPSICFQPDARSAIVPTPDHAAPRSVLILLIVPIIGLAYRPVGAAAPALTVVHQAPRKPAPGKPPMLVLLHGFGANEQDLLPMAARLDPRLAVASVRGPYQIRPAATPG